MSDLSAIFADLDKHFLGYLVSKGIDAKVGGFIKCLNPNHPDKNPSMHIINSGDHDGTAGYCFSCHCHVDILHAVHFIEKKPISGIGFFEETLPYLTKMFGIEYEPVQITNEQRDLFQKRQSVRDAMQVCHAGAYKNNQLNIEHPAIEHLIKRGITEQTIKDFKIGCIDGYQSYIDSMKNLGWDNQEWLKRVDLANKGLFNKEGIIIPIFDHKNSVVGFVTRTTKMNPNDKGQSKYVNSVNSDIYHKGEILFNFNNYKPEDGPLYIVEGYIDAIYLTQSGLKNVVALGSTVLTDQHVNMLMDYKIKNVVICLDADEGGYRGVKIAIERMSPYKIFKMRIMELPEGEDPDTFVRKNGLDKFIELSSPDIALSAFAWTLKHSSFEDDPVNTAEKAIPTIASEESSIVRLKMIKELVKLTNISEADIRRDVDSLVNKESSQFIEELKEVNQWVQVALNRRKLKDTKLILSDAIKKITSIESKFDNKVDHRSEFSNKRHSLRDKIESGEFKYGLMAPHHKAYEKLFDGIPYTTNLNLIGGRPGASKTTWLTALGIDIIEANPDAAILYMSIDDSTELMTLKILAQKTGFSTSKLKAYQKLSIDERKIINEAWLWFDKLSERLIITDATQGKSVDNLEAHVDWFCKTFSGCKRLCFLDNFHKLQKGSTRGSGGKKTEEISDQSEKVKDITQLNDIHLLATVELRKLENSVERPRPDDMKDTVQLEYDADIITLIHNDLNTNSESSIVWNGLDEENNPAQMPYTEVVTWKNKVTGKIGASAYKLNKVNLRLEEVKWSSVKVLIDNERKRRKSKTIVSSGSERTF